MECIPVKLCQDNGGSIKPDLLAISNEIDSLDDLPDVSAVLERSGILDATGDAGTPNSLKSFDVSDFAIEDGGDGLPFDSILELPDHTSVPAPSLLLPAGGIGCSGGQESQTLSSSGCFPLYSDALKPDLVVLRGPNPFSANLTVAPHIAINPGIFPTLCHQQIVVKPDGCPKFVSSILSGSDENRKIAACSRNGKNRPPGGSGLAFPKDRAGPEYQRVMDILTEYHVQVAEKSAEALMPCKRRKNRPIVDAADVVKSGRTTPNQSGVVTSSGCSPGSRPPQMLRRVTEQPGDLPSSASVAGSGPAVDVPRVYKQSTGCAISADSHYNVNSKPVLGCVMDDTVPHAVLSQGLSGDVINSMPSSCLSAEVAFQYSELSSLAYNSACSLADSSSDKSSGTSVKSCGKGLEPIPECHCTAAGKHLYLNCGICNRFVKT